MAKQKSSATQYIEEVMIDAATVQLASFNAGIEFWSRWVEQASKMSETWRKGLQSYMKNPEDSVATMLEMTEASRQHLRTMSELSRHTADRFVDELDKIEKMRKAGGKKTKTKTRRATRAKS